MIDATEISGISILLLRLIIAIIMFSSGRGHASSPVDRGKSLGMSPTLARILGIIEIIAALSLALGVFTQIGAAIVIVVMLGAIFKKVFIWDTGFYAEKGFGWHYDILILAGSLVIFATAGGNIIIY